MTEEEKHNVLETGYENLGGESREAFHQRIKEFMVRLENMNCENVAVFTHAGWLCGMLDEVVKVHISRQNICCNNCTVGIFEYRDKNWRLYSWINV